MGSGDKIKAQLEDLFSELIAPSIVHEDALPSVEEPEGGITGRREAREQLVYRALVESVADAVALSDLEGCQTYGNRACYESFGYDYDRQDMNGLPMASLWLEDDVPTLIERVLPQAMAGGWSGQVRQKRRDGTIFDAHLTIFPVLDSSEVINIATIIRDVSERKALERERDAVYEHRAFQIELIAGLAQEIVAASTLDELYRSAVTLVKEHFGYYHVQVFHYVPELSAMVRVQSYSHSGEETEPASYRLPYGKGIIGIATTTGKPILVPDVSQNYYWMPYPDFPDAEGELAVPIKVRGQVIGVLDVLSDTAGALTREDEVVLLDLTSRITSVIGSTHLLRGAEGFRQLVQDLEGIGWIALEDNVFIYVNSALCRILGAVRPKDTLGKPIVSYYPKAMRKRIQREILPAVMRGDRWTGELTILSARGETVPVIQSIFLVRNQDGTPLHLATVVTDISEQRGVEKLLDKRVQQIDCLNEMARKMKEIPPTPALLQWVVERIPSVMRYPDLCLVAIGFEGHVYGEDEAVRLPCQIVEYIYSGGEAVGQVYVSYTQRHDFLDEEVALLGDIVRRVSSYVESQRLMEQTNTALEEAKASHKLYLPTRLAEHETEPIASEGCMPPKPIPAYGTGLKARLRNSRVYTALRRAWQRLTR